MNFAATTAQQPERLKALRLELARLECDGVFIPLADEYLNEYVPDYAQRLAWLTGFTGSAGLALIMRDKAALFVDGRYTLQAAQQVDGTLYEIVHTTKTPLTDYLKANLKGSEKIGYDPWLHTSAWLERVGMACKAAGAQLLPLSSNLIDAIWLDKPLPPKAPIFAHPLSLAGESSESKRARLSKELTEKNTDAAMITDPASIAWLLNVRGGDVEATPLPLSFAILNKSGLVDWFVDPDKVADLPPQKGVQRHAPAQFMQALKALGVAKAKVRVDAEGSASAILSTLQDAGAVLDRGEDPCELPKACKNNVEVEGMHAAHKRDGLALTRFLCWLAQQPAGSTNEITAQEKLHDLRTQNNQFFYPSFPSISGAGPNGAIVHYRASDATNRKLNAGEFYLIDSGGQYADGTTDVTRTIAIGDVSATMKDHFTRVLKGHIALALARFPKGTAGAQLDILARKALWDVGLDYDHGTGHGVGAFLGVHEGPQGISGRARVPLQAGMIISNEPGYYLAGHYGIRIENLVVVRESAVKIDDKPMLEFETLTLAPIDRNAINPALLADDERKWLNVYHARVYQAHENGLSEPEKAWLRSATAPL